MWYKFKLLFENAAILVQYKNSLYRNSEKSAGRIKLVDKLVQYIHKGTIIIMETVEITEGLGRLRALQSHLLCILARFWGNLLCA